MCTLRTVVLSVFMQQKYFSFRRIWVPRDASMLVRLLPMNCRKNKKQLLSRYCGSLWTKKCPCHPHAWSLRQGEEWEGKAVSDCLFKRTISVAVQRPYPRWVRIMPAFIWGDDTLYSFRENLFFLSRSDMYACSLCRTSTHLQIEWLIRKVVLNFFFFLVVLSLHVLNSKHVYSLLDPHWRISLVPFTVKVVSCNVVFISSHGKILLFYLSGCRFVAWVGVLWPSLLRLLIS